MSNEPTLIQSAASSLTQKSNQSLETLTGLSCPKCGGMVPIPEGQVIVCCPYCDLRSFVKGERGLRRFQVGQTVGRDQADRAMRQFLSRNLAIARDAARTAQLTDVFLAYLPFWTVWGRAIAWAFGQEKKGSGNDAHYEPREVKIVEDLSWNGAACDVSELGVGHVPLNTETLQPFNPDALHSSGLVFEPVGSFSDARASAESTFQERVRKRARLDRISQLFMRFFRIHYGLVYYPLWVLRYLYHGRAFQVVVDGCSGKVLYGKAPGNTIYRAAMLVGGMALGALLAVDGSALGFYLTSDKNSDNSIWLGIAAIIVGLTIMVGAYRKFRYGEQFEHRTEPLAPSKSLLSKNLPSDLGDIGKWLNRLS